MTPGPKAAYVIRHPGAFALRVIKGFRANQGLLLAGAVAYYALLSIVPLLILMAIALSHVVDQSALLEALGRYIGWLAPGQSDFIVGELPKTSTGKIQKFELRKQAGSAVAIDV